MVCCKNAGMFNAIEKKAYSQKKVTKVDQLSANLEIIFDVIDYINAQDEFVYSIWGNHPLDEINILNEFKDFILPSAVRYDALNRRSKDLLVKPVYESVEPKFSYADYVEACDKFRAYFKKDGYSDVTKVGDLRKAVNLNDVITRASFDGKVCAQGKSFIPIPLVNIGLFEDRYFNETVNDIINDYITDMRFI